LLHHISATSLPLSPLPAELEEYSTKLEQVQATADELNVVKESQTRLLEQQKKLIGKQANTQKEGSASIAKLEKERVALENELEGERARVEDLLAKTQTLTQAKDRLQQWKEVGCQGSLIVTLRSHAQTFSRTDVLTYASIHTHTHTHTFLTCAIENPLVTAP
jgi:predicted ribosome quality control (RQC) complex YloA/Tae2 family protein